MFIDEISDRLIQPAAELWEKQKKNENEILLTALEKFLLICKNYHLTMTKLEAAELKSGDVWQNLKKFINEVLEWTDNVKTIAEQQTVAGIWAEWQKTLLEIFADYPEEIRLELTELISRNFHSRNPRILVWKFLQNLRVRITYGYTVFRNRIGHIFKKKPLPPKKYTTKISSHLFITWSIGLPFARHFLNEWQNFLHETAQFFAELHDESEAIKDDLFVSEDIFKSCDTFQAENFNKHMTRVENLLKNIENRLSILNEKPVDSSRRLEEYWNDISTTIPRLWNHAGTPALPAKKFSASAIPLAWKNLEKRYNEYQNSWTGHYFAEEKDWCKDLDLSLLQIDAGLICQEKSGLIERKIRERFIPNLETIRQSIHSSLENLRKIRREDLSRLAESIRAENSAVIDKMRSVQLPHLIDEIRAAAIDDDLRTFIPEIKAKIDQLQEQHHIFRERDLRNRPPHSRTDQVALKNLIMEEFFPEMKSSFEEQKNEIQEELESLVRHITETDQIIEFNLDAALNLLAENPETNFQSASDMALEGLSRAEDHIESIIQKSLSLSEKSRKIIQETTRYFEENIRKLGDNQKIFELRVRLAKARTKEEFRTRSRYLLVYIRRTIPSFWKTFRSLLEKLYHNYLRLRKIAGLEAGAARMEDTLAEFLTETQKRITSLPYVYQRLFRVEPLEDARFFSGRSEELEKLKNELDIWKNGQNIITAIVGERGSGKTTLLNFIRREYQPQFSLHTYEFPRRITDKEEWLDELKNTLEIPDVQSFEELENRINSSSSRKIVIVENMQYLFIKTVRGFKTMERFLLFMARTSDRIYWLVTYTIYSWYYLDKVIGISRYIGRIIYLENLSQDEVENIILKRHRVSGFRLEFAIPEEILKTRRYRKLSTEEERQKYLQDKYFRDLNEFSSGNITITLLFWLISIEGVTKEKIVVNPQFNFDFTFLHQMPVEELFALATFMQHENLTINQIAIILRQNPEKSALLIARLASNGILLRNERGYYIHPFLYRAVVRVLKLKNILH